MAFSSGTFSLVAGNPVVTGTTISSTWANDTLEDIDTNGLTLCLLKDGTQTVTANIPMAGFKFTGLGAGSASGDSATIGGTETLSAKTFVTPALGTPASGVRTNITGVTTENARAASYQYTAWDPSDVSGSVTNASATAAATLTATDYITMANASGTLTLTFAKAGNYLVNISMQNEVNNALTGALRGRVTLGGSATRYFGPTIATLISDYTAASANANQAASVSIMVAATANQTLTVLPDISVTSSGATTDFTTQCSVNAAYMGTT